MPSRFPRRELTRIMAPLAFLAAVTILVLLIHSALSGHDNAATTTVKRTHPRVTTTLQTTTQVTRPKKRRHRTTHAARYYIVVAGDTFGNIAAKEGTTVEKLIALNPNTDSSALSIGQKIRVG